MSWFGDLVDNVKALFSGEKKVFGENVNKKKSSKKITKKALPITMKSDGTYVSDKTGKSYSSVYDYLSKENYAQNHVFENFRKDYLEYKKGNISYDELFKNFPSRKKQQRIEYQKEYDKKYAEEHASDRGILDKVLGMIGYNGVVEGLYNILDDDPNTTFSSGLKKGLHYMNPFTNDVSQRRSGSDLVKLLESPDKNPDKFNIEDVLKLGHNFVSVASKANLLLSPIKL